MGGSTHLNVSFSTHPQSLFLTLFLTLLLHELHLEDCGAAVVCLMLRVGVSSGNTLLVVGGVRRSQ